MAAAVLTLTGGCRVLSPRLEVGTAERPPRLVVPQDPCPSVRRAAGELANLLDFAYDLSLQLEEVADLTGLADQDHSFSFFIGFAPPRNFASLRENEFGYAVTDGGVYFFGRPPDSRLNNEDTSWSSPAIDLAVYRFLENEMGFRWLTLEPCGYYFPPAPSRLRRGAEETVRARPVDWPEEGPERGLTARRQWLRRFGVVVGHGPENNADGEPANMRSLLFPGQEHRLAEEGEKEKGGALPAVTKGGGALDWGLSDFARYVAAKTLAGDSADWTELLDDFVLGMNNEPAAQVRRYFEFWRETAEGYRQKQGCPLPVAAFDLYTESRLRKSEEWLLQAQGTPGLGASARFRLESLRLGHQHLSLTRESWESLQRATEPQDLDAARQANRRLVQARRQLAALTNIDPASLTANEAALGDLAGTEFHRKSSGLTGVRRILSWRVRENGEPSGTPAQWRRPDDIDWSSWRECKDARPGILAESTAARWFAATPAGEETESQPDQLCLLVWGWTPESEVYLNGIRLTVEKSDDRQAMASACLRIPAENLAEDRRQLLIFRPGKGSVFAPARAVWLMSGRPRE